MKIITDSIRFHRIILEVILSPFFWILTVSGNLVILIFSYSFFLLEADINPALGSFIDALWWGFATATTVGYGDITPKTALGKVLGMAFMLLGTALFGLYTAFFAQAIIEDDFIISKKRPRS